MAKQLERKKYLSVAIIWEQGGGNLPGQAGGDSGHAALATGGILSGWERGLDGGNTLYKHLCHHDHHLPQHIVYI